MRTLVLLCVALAAPTSARAGDVQAAKQHFDRGQTLYDLQRYLDSAREYELAYEAQPDPAFLYDIGQAYRLGGDPAKALGAYRAFRRQAPEAAARIGIGTRIADMEKQVAASRPAPQPSMTAEPPRPAVTALPAAVATPAPSTAPATPPTAVTPIRRASRAKIISGAVITGAGVALLSAGAGLTVMGRSAYDQLQSATDGYVFDPATQDAMNSYYPAGLALIGIGAAAVLTGATLLALAVRERSRRFSALASPAGTFLKIAF